MVGVLVGGRVADSVSPRRLALVTAGGAVFGLLGSAAATSVATMIGRLRRPGRRLDRAGLCHRRARRGHRAVPPRTGGRPGGERLCGRRGRPRPGGGGAARGRRTWLDLRAAGRGTGWRPRRRGRARSRRFDRPAPGTGSDPLRPSGLVVALWLVFGLGSAPALAAFAQAGELAGTPSAVALAVPLLNIGNLVGRLVAGPLSDRVGRSAALHGNSALLRSRLSSAGCGITRARRAGRAAPARDPVRRLVCASPLQPRRMRYPATVRDHLRPGLHRMGPRRACWPRWPPRHSPPRAGTAPSTSSSSSSPCWHGCALRCTRG